MSEILEIIIKNKRKELIGYGIDALSGYIEASEHTTKTRALTENEAVTLVAVKRELKEREEQCKK